MFAAAQADPLHRIYDVFIPLVDLCQDGDGTPHMQVDVREVGEGESVGVGEAERKKKRAWWDRPQATPLSDARAAGLFKEALHMPQGTQFTTQFTYFTSTKVQILTPEDLRARPPALWARAE